MRTRGKLFGIGLSKTGTLSLHTAFGMLGLRSCHWRHAQGPRKGRIVLPEDFQHYDAGSDVTAGGVFPLLDEMYPGSRFIYTVRELNAWAASICKEIYYAQYWQGQRRVPEANLYHIKDKDWFRLTN